MSETNDYHLSYSRPFTKRKKVKDNRLYSLWYGNECLVLNVAKSLCFAMKNKLKNNVNYKLQKFEIK